MMIKKMLVVTLMAFCLQAAHAEENLFAKNYKEQNTSNLKSMQASPDTKLYVSNHYDEDNISMLQDGYDMMGTSGFEAGSIKPDMALEHARSIKADVVLVYSKYASKKSSLSKLELIKEAAKTSGEIDAKSLESQDDEQYKYYASYWAKLPMPLLGLHVIKLSHKDKDTGKSVEEDGLKVLAVIKESPAFKAGLKRGDVLLKMGSVDIQTPAKLSEAAMKYAGKQVKISYKRDEEAKTAEATLNSR
ncbi:MAG: PDZ domain-containing protein [Methylophilaceae bacterium]